MVKITLTSGVYLMDKSTMDKSMDTVAYRVHYKIQPERVVSYVMDSSSYSAPKPTTSGDDVINVVSLRESEIRDNLESIIYTINTVSKKSSSPRPVFILNADLGPLVSAYVLMNCGYTPFNARENLYKAMKISSFMCDNIIEDYVVDYNTIALYKMIPNNENKPIVLCSLPGFAALKSDPAYVAMMTNCLVFTFGNLTKQENNAFDGFTRVEYQMAHEEMIEQEIRTARNDFTEMTEKIEAACYHSGGAYKAMILCDVYTYQRAAAVAAHFYHKFNRTSGGKDMFSIDDAVRYVDSIFDDQFFVKPDTFDITTAPIAQKKSSRALTKRRLQAIVKNIEISNNTWDQHARFDDTMF